MKYSNFNDKELVFFLCLAASPLIYIFLNLAANVFYLTVEMEEIQEAIKVAMAEYRHWSHELLKLADKINNYMNNRTSLFELRCFLVAYSVLSITCAWSIITCKWFFSKILLLASATYLPYLAMEIPLECQGIWNLDVEFVRQVGFTMGRIYVNQQDAYRKVQMLMQKKEKTSALLETAWEKLIDFCEVIDLTTWLAFNQFAVIDPNSVLG